MDDQFDAILDQPHENAGLVLIVKLKKMIEEKQKWAISYNNSPNASKTTIQRVTEEIDHLTNLYYWIEEDMPSEEARYLEKIIQRGKKLEVDGVVITVHFKGNSLPERMLHESLNCKC